MRSYAIFGPGKISGVPYTNRAHVYRKLDSIKDVSRLILDGGVGIGALAEAWAVKNGVPFEHYKPDYTAVDLVGFSPSFTLRDAQMIADAEAVAVFTIPALNPHLRVVAESILAKKDLFVFHI